MMIACRRKLWKARICISHPGRRDCDVKAGKSRQKREGWHLCTWTDKPAENIMPPTAHRMGGRDMKMHHGGLSFTLYRWKPVLSVHTVWQTSRHMRKNSAESSVCWCSTASSSITVSAVFTHASLLTYRQFIFTQSAGQKMMSQKLEVASWSKKASTRFMRMNVWPSVFWPSVLWRCWLGGRKGIRPVKTEWWGAGMVICLERGADLHMAQLMPLPLTVSCFSKIQIGSGSPW